MIDVSMMTDSTPHSSHSAPLIAAHRGASTAETENTIAAFERAIAGGADSIELDIRWTADGTAVVYHDPAVARNGIRTPVKKLTLAEFTALKAQQGITVPTLAEALQWAKDTTPLVFDIKDTGREDELIAEVERYGFHPRSVFSSFRLTVIGKIKARRPEWCTAWIIGNTGGALMRMLLAGPIITRALRWGADALHYHASWISPELLQRCAKEHLHVAVWTVDRPADIRTFAELGVDTIITNVPETARRTLAEHFSPPIP